jgi:hypothetical protein
MAGHDPYDLPGDAPNPYAAPRADLKGAGEYGPGGMEVPPFSIGAVWNMAWPMFKERMGLVIGVVFGAMVVNYAVQFGLSFLSSMTAVAMQGQGNANAAGGAAVGLQLIASLLSIVFSLWIAAGQTVALMKIARGREASFNDVFGGGPYFLSILWGGILLGLCIIGAIGVVGIPMGILVYFVQRSSPDALVPMLAVLYLMALAAILFVMARTFLYQYAIVDRQLGGLDAIRHSFRITQGHTLSIVGLLIVAGVLGISGILACGVGLIFTASLATLMYPCAYLILDNQPSVTGAYGKPGDLVDL